MPAKRHTEGPLSPQLQCAIEHYVDTRDPDRAAQLARMEPKEFRRFMKHEDVAALIQKKVDLVDIANAQVRAQARVLTVDKLDASLVEVLTKFKGAKTLRERVKAIEIGYKRHGALREKMEHSGEGGGPLVFELVRLGGKKPASERGDNGTAAAIS